MLIGLTLLDEFNDQVQSCLQVCNTLVVHSVDRTICFTLRLTNAHMEQISLIIAHDYYLSGD